MRFTIYSQMDTTGITRHIQIYKSLYTNMNGKIVFLQRKKDCSKRTVLKIMDLVELNYLSSQVAPAAARASLRASASAVGIASLTVAGAPSTIAFASLRPRPVASRTALIT